ncbi:MAG: ArsR/SmtB family transcription factor [Candidatus Hodarchaeota archaeon]
MSKTNQSGVDLEIIDEYAESFKAMGNPLRLAILFILFASEFRYGEKSLSFRQIQDILGFPDKRRPTSSLHHHINVLLENHFIERVPYQEESGKSQVTTLYHVAAKGREFLKTFGMYEKIREVALKVLFS